LEKAWKVMERYNFSLRLDGQNIPVRLNLTNPDTTVNLNSPQNFGKFAPISTNSSQLGTPNGHLTLCFRLQF
jgi:hypothetical protein